jgi:hypothetical protein
MGAKLATWEDKEALMQQFLFAPAWGQAGAQGGGGDVSVLDAAHARKSNGKYVGPEWAV